MMVLEGELLSPPEVPVFIKMISVHGSIQLSTTLTIVPYPSHWKPLSTMLLPWHRAGDEWCTRTRCFKLRLKNSISGLSDQRILFLPVWESFWWYLCKLPVGFHVSFTEEKLLSGHSALGTSVISSHTSAFSLSSYPLAVFSMSFRGIRL